MYDCTQDCEDSERPVLFSSNEEYQSNEYDEITETYYDELPTDIRITSGTGLVVNATKIGDNLENKYQTKNSSIQFNVDVPEFIPRSAYSSQDCDYSLSDMPRSKSKPHSAKASNVRLVHKSTQIQVHSKNAYAQTNKLESSIFTNIDAAILINEKNRDPRIDMLLEENKNLHQKLTSNYIAKYEAQTLKDNITSLENKLEEQQQKLYNKEKNIEIMKSLLSKQSLNYLNLQKYIISKHLHRCKVMLDDLNSVLPRLSTTTIPSYDECYTQFGNWKLELAKTEKCLLLFNEYQKQLVNCIHTCNLIDIPNPPDIISEFTECKDILHDNFMVAVNYLLKDLYYYQRQNQEFHQQYTQWYNNYERVNMHRTVATAAPVRYFPVVPQIHIQPSFATYNLPRTTARPSTQSVVDLASPVLQQTETATVSDCKTNSTPDSFENCRTPPCTDFDKNLASNELENNAERNRAINETETVENTDLMSCLQTTEIESPGNLSQEPTLTQNIDLRSETVADEYFCDSPAGSLNVEPSQNVDFLENSNKIQNCNKETEIAEIWYAKEDTKYESEKEDSDFQTAIQEGNESKESACSSHTNAAWAENFFLVPPAKFESTKHQLEVENQFLIPPAKFESVDNNIEQQAAETEVPSAKFETNNDSDSEQRTVENQFATNELSSISADNEDIYADLPEVVRKSSAGFCSLFIFIRDRLPDMDQMELLRVLQKVRRNTGGLSGKTRGTILNDIKAEISLNMEDCREETPQ